MDTIRKWLYKPKADDKSLLARFYHADRALTAVASELDSFDGRAEPERCSRLVSRLRQGQDRVLAITNQIMDELLLNDRTPRAFRAKFPEEVLQESLAGQLWFGAECLAAGSSIMNHEEESAAMRPLAKAVTKSLDNVRNLLREQCLRNNIPNSPTLSLDLNDAATETLYESLKIFDRLFAEFELSYVSAMVHVKSKQEHEMQELICVLFSETLQRALKIGLLEQEQVDAFDPSIMFSIPRLAIVAGLVIYERGPLNMDLPADQMSEMFRPFRTLLIRIRDLLGTLNKTELYQLEKLLCTNEEIHLKNNRKFNCDDEKTNSDDDLVSKIVKDCRTASAAVKEGGVQSFYPPTTVVEDDSDDDQEEDIGDDEENGVNGDGGGEDDESNVGENRISMEWAEDGKDREILVQPDCATGYLIPNTNFGNLFQTTQAPLTDSFIADSDDEYNNSTRPQNLVADQEYEGEQIDVKLLRNVDGTSQGAGGLYTAGDSGISTENTSLDRTPETETSETLEKGNSVLSQRYAGNWENLEKSQPSCSKTNSDSSDESEITGTGNAPVIVRPSKSDKCGGKSTKGRSHKSSSSSVKKRSKDSRSDSTSSCETSSCQSDGGDPQEVALAIRAAGRMKFKSIENLLHRLFVCIAGVADQLQTNFASDLRQILRSVFLINSTPPEDEIVIPEKPKESDMFEFRPSENDVLQQENSGGSNQSIYSAAEEVSPESDSVFEAIREERSSSLESDTRVPVIRQNHTMERSRSLGENPSEQDNLSNSPDVARQYNDNKRSNSVRERNRKSSNNVITASSNHSSPVNFSPENSPSHHHSNQTYHHPPRIAVPQPPSRTPEQQISSSPGDTIDQQQPQHNCRTQPRTGVSEKPPRWIPDEEAPRCMACTIPFTAFRRRHHCRNCGGVFCGGCSNSSAPLPKYGLTKAVRVCRDCYVREVGV